MRIFTAGKASLAIPTKEKFKITTFLALNFE